MTRLKQLRLAAGLAQRELARLSHVKPGKIAALEKGTLDIASEALSVARRIAAVLGVPIEALIEDELNEKKQ